MSANPDRNSAGYKWSVMSVVIVGTLMTALDSSIVNISIPSIMTDFGSDIDSIEWVITSYMIALATTMPLIAWFRDRIGYRKLYYMSLIVFTAGSLMCGLAWNLPTLIIARIIQAFGGGAITPTGMAMITEVFPRKERSKAIGIWGMSVMIGPAVGPTLGGYLTHAFGWRSIFLVNIPVGIIGVAAAMKILARDEVHSESKRPLDIWGLVFLSIFLVTFLLGMSKGEKLGWTSITIAGLFVTSVVSLIGFLLVERVVEDGIIDISLFKSATFTICAIASSIRSLILFGGIFLLPMFLQQQMGFDEMQSGLIMMPGALAVAVFMPVGGKLGDKVGARLPALIGLACLAAFMFLYHDINVNTPVFSVIFPMLVRGIGLALMMAPITAAAMNSVPTRKTGMASSMINIAQQIGGSVGVVMFGTILTNRAAYHTGVVSETVKSGSPEMMNAIKAVAAHAHEYGLTHLNSMIAAKSAIIAKLYHAAGVMAFQDAFMIGGFVALAAMIPALFLPDRDALKKQIPADKLKAEVSEEMVIVE